MKKYRVFIVALFCMIYQISAQEKEKSFPASETISLKQAISELESRYNVRFSYVDQTIAGLTVRTPIHGNDLNQSLEYILSRKPLSYKRIGKNIIVLYEDDFKKREASDQTALIRLTIVDTRTSEGIYFANVTIPGIRRGALSDAHGQAVIQRIPYGTYTLRITALGYLPYDYTLHISSKEFTLDTIRLEPSDMRLDSTVVYGDRETWRVNDPKLRVQPSVIVIDRRKINSTPSVLEPDLFRTLQTLPGVTSPNDLSNELYVRGGTPDQNLITMDRAIVYQPYHLFGIAGIFNTDAIDQVNFSTGGFSAQYGNRLSSVIDVRSKSNSPEKFSATGNVSLLSSKITIDGQPSNNWYYLVSLRRTYLDYATKAIKALAWIPEDIPYNFYDGLTKILYRPNNLHELGFSVFFSRDQFFQNTKDYEYQNISNQLSRRLPIYRSAKLDHGWSNINASLHWDWQMSDLFRFRTTVFQSASIIKLDQDIQYRYEKGAPDSIRYRADSLNRISDDKPFDTRNRIIDRTVLWDAQWEFANQHTLYFGGEISKIHLSYFWNNFEAPPGYIQVFYDFAADSFRYHQNMTQSAFYVEDLWRINDWTIKPGFRFEYFSHSTGDILVSPRLAVRYDYSPNLALKASGGLYHQSLFTSRERGYIGFLEIPFATTDRSVERATHFIVGFEYFPKSETRWSSDIYYKKFNRLYRKKRSSEDLRFQNGSGEAMGCELTYRRIGKKWSYELDYSLAWVRRTFEGRTYVTNYDQRHTLSALLSYQLPKNWKFDSRWILTSGRAYRPTNFYGGNAQINPISGESTYPVYSTNIGNEHLDHLEFYDRYPLYHRLDVSFVKTVQFKNWKFKPYVSLINTYYNNNPLFYTYESGKSLLTDEPDPQRLYYEKRKSYGIPILPTFGAFFEF